MGRSEVARLEGRLSDARRPAQQAIEAFWALGIPGGAAGCEQARGRMELLSGDPAAALTALQRSDAIFAQLGDRAFRSPRRPGSPRPTCYWRIGTPPARRSS